MSLRRFPAVFTSYILVCLCYGHQDNESMNPTDYTVNCFGSNSVFHRNIVPYGNILIIIDIVKDPFLVALTKSIFSRANWFGGIIFPFVHQLTYVPEQQ